MLSAGGLFITGTDTGVGKTVTTAAIAVVLQSAGKRVVPFKPVQTGCSSGALTDAEFVQRAIDNHEPLDVVCPYRLSLPLAPAVAARLEGVAIEPDVILRRLKVLRRQYDAVLVEGAGGLLVPLTARSTMADLAARIGFPVVVVSRPGLGTLNHTALTVEAARLRGLSVAGVVLAGFPAEPGLAELTNPAELVALGAPLLGVLRHDEGLSVEEGKLGALQTWAAESLVPELGGCFEAAIFLSDLRKRIESLAFERPAERGQRPK